MNMSQSHSAINFINSLSRRIAARTNAKDNKSVPSSKKLIAKSLLQITDSQLKETLESNLTYFEKLLDLTIAQYVSEASEDFAQSTSRSKNNYLCLNAPQFHFKDTLSLSKTSSHATVDALVSSILHTRGCTPQMVATTLVSVVELPLASTGRLAQVLHTRLALYSHEWCESPLAWDSSMFLLAFTTVHACRSSPLYVSDPCWSVATTIFQDVSCFTFIGYVSYWMMTLAAKGISFSDVNKTVLLSQLLVLLASARKQSEYLVADEDDPSAPIACLLTQHWLQSVPDSSEKKLILREIYTFMRQWEGGHKLQSLWVVLAAACGVDVEIDSELVVSGAAQSSGRYVKFAEWFIHQENLVSGAMRRVEVSVSSKKTSSGLEGEEEDMYDDDEIDIVLDGKANMPDEFGDEEEEGDEGKVEFLDERYHVSGKNEEEEESPVTFFLDKQGSVLMDDSITSESSQILADLGDVGEKSTKKSKKRKSSLAIIEEDAETEHHDSPQKPAAKTRKGKSKKTATPAAAATEDEEKMLTRPTRSTRSTRSSSQ